MQIVHKINDFLYTLFPELENATEKEIITAIQKYYTYGPFVPKITIDKDIVTINVNTEIIQTQDSDYNKTVALCEKGKFDEAKIILEKLIQKNPSNSEFHRILGQILSEQGDQDEAINALIDALRWNSSNGWGLLMMGNIFAKHKKDLKTAMIYYDQAILANKADHYPLTKMCYHQTGPSIQTPQLVFSTSKIVHPPPLKTRPLTSSTSSAAPSYPKPTTQPKP
jgi:tetratricopeptide (TPR) repeat protein